VNGKDIACTTKKRYPSRSQAKKTLKIQHRQGRRTLVIYQCWYCGEFHIGNPPGKQTYKRPGNPFGVTD
jgi:hypothetical protein